MTRTASATDPGEKTQRSRTPSSWRMPGPSVMRSLRTAPKLAIMTADASRSCTTPSTVARTRKLSRRSTARAALSTYAATPTQLVEVPGARLAILDTSIPFSATGQVTAAQLAWLGDVAADAARDGVPLLVFGHHHPWDPSSPTREPGYFGINPDDSERLVDVAAAHRSIVGYFAGHTHRNRIEAMIRVTLEGLTKRHDRVAVVDGASLEIPPGELTFLLGPSGAGKTTLPRLVAGLDTLDEGEIFFDDRVMNVVPAQERKVGLVFQDDALWPRLSVADNIGYGLKVQRMPRAERRERVAEAMGALRIDSLAVTTTLRLGGEPLLVESADVQIAVAGPLSEADIALLLREAERDSTIGNSVQRGVPVRLSQAGTRSARS